MQRNFEQVVSVIDWEHFYFSLASQRVDLVAKEKGEVDWLFDTLESARGLALEEHVFQVGRSGVNEAVSFVEAARFNFGCFLLTVHNLKVFVQDHDARLCNHSKVREAWGPVESLYLGHLHFKHDFSC